LSRGPSAAPSALTFDSNGNQIEEHCNTWMATNWGDENSGNAMECDVEGDSHLQTQTSTSTLHSTIESPSYFVHDDTSDTSYSELGEYGLHWSASQDNFDSNSISTSSSDFSAWVYENGSDMSFSDAEFYAQHGNPMKLEMPRWQQEYFLYKFVEKASTFLKHGKYYQFAMLNNSITKLRSTRQEDDW